MISLRLFVLFLGTIFITTSIQLQLSTNETCLEYTVDNIYTRKLFYFHFNHNIDQINLVLMKKGYNQIWLETGFGIDFKTTLEAQYEETGTYTFCFWKKSQGIADVSFEIVDEDSMSFYVGKEQLAKISRRISQFLMDIKRVGFTFKQVLEQHNSRKQVISQQQKGYLYLLLLKILVMLIIVVSQIIIVKKIYK